MSLFVYGAILFLLSSPLVVLSNSVLNRVEVVRHAGSSPKADAFSNPSCTQSYCSIQGTYCYTDCCKCQCSNDRANYIVNKWKCFSRNELNQMNSTKCTYSIRKPEEPLLVLPLTEVMVQKVSFTNEDSHRTLIPCNESIQISWEYRDAFGKWKNGEGNIFSVEVEIEPNPNVPSKRDQRVIKALEWTGKLRSEYAGLLIRFLFKCKGNIQGCALAKISGEHTYGDTRFSTARPPTTTENPPTTTTENPPTTTENPPTTTENPPTTTENPPTTTENPPTTTTENPPTTTENPPTTTTENPPTTTENPPTTTGNPPTTTETTSTASLPTSRNNPTTLMMIIVNVIIVIGRHLITSQP